MERLELKTLEIRNFKSISREKLRFHPGHTVIRGRAGAGKSSVFDAWCWLFFGKDRFRRDLTLQKTAVTARVLLDGRPLQLEKTLETGGRPVYCLNRKAWSGADFQKAVKGLWEEETFYLLSDPVYLLERMSLREKQALFHRLDPRGDCEACRKQAAAVCRSLEPADQALPARIREQEWILKQMGISDFPALEDRCSCLRQKRDRLLSQPREDAMELGRILLQMESLQRALGLRELSDACGRRVKAMRQQELEKRNTRCARLRQLETAKKQYETAVKAWEKQLNARISPISFRLFSADAEKTGGIFLGDRDTGSLSSREKVVAGLELIRFLNGRFSWRVPVFTEEMPDVRSPGLQTVSFLRDEDAKGLEVD